MNHFFARTILAALLLAFAACDTKKNDPVECGANRMSVNDRSIELQSAFSLSETDWEYGRIWASPSIRINTRQFRPLPL